MFNQPNITPNTMTKEEIRLAWQPELDRLYSIIIDTTFGPGTIDNYESALRAYSNDWHKATDYKEPVATDCYELPF